MENVLVSGVTYNKNEAKITIKKIPDRPGIAARVFSEISKSGIVVDMIIQTPSSKDGHANLAFTVPSTDYARTLKMIQKLGKELEAGDVVGNEDVAKISIIGVGMRSHTSIASRMFVALASEGVNIIMISTSEIKISCLINAKYTELAVRALHDTFELDKDPREESL
jgi:aspartate kinase